MIPRPAPRWLAALVAALAILAPMGSGQVGATAQRAALPDTHEVPAARDCLAAAPPGAEAGQAPVEVAGAIWDVGAVLRAVADCREARAARPTDPAVLEAHGRAAGTLAVLVHGLPLPADAAADLAKALADYGRLSAREREDTFGRATAFHIASALEYGIGARPDLVEAVRWYHRAAEAGDPVSRGAITRILYRLGRS